MRTILPLVCALLHFCVGPAAADDISRRPSAVAYYVGSSSVIQPQNWAIAQDERGFVYVGSKEGVSVYDGSEWRLVRTSSTVRSLAVGYDDRVYVGLQGDVGYLQASQSGEMDFVSLQAESQLPEFEDVWATHNVKGTIVFQTSSYLFLWDGHKFELVESDGAFHTSFCVGNRLYVRVRKAGLFHLSGSDLKLVDGGERFADEKVYGMVPFDQHRLLVGTKYGPTFLLGDDGLRPLATDADDILPDAPLYHASVMAGGHFGLATFGAGVLVIDSAGRLVARLDEATGYPDNVVNYLFYDREFGLWVATNNSGLHRVSLPTPIQRFGRSNGLTGVIYDVLTTREKVYVATGVGLYVAAKEATTMPSLTFTRVGDVDQSWSLAPLGDKIVAASENGLWLVDGDSARLIDENPHYAVRHSDVRPTDLYVGSRDVFRLLRLTGSRLHVVSTLPLGSGPVNSIVEAGDSTVWIGTRQHGLIVARLESGDRLVRMAESTGLPSGPVMVSRLMGRPVAANVDGLFVPEIGLQDGTLSFRRDTTVLAMRSGRDSLLTFHSPSSARAWFVMSDRVEVAAVDVKGAIASVVPDALQGMRSGISRIFVENGGVAWISRGDELYRYDPHVVKNYDVPYRSFVRRVSDSRTDSVLFGGNFRNESGGFGTVQLEAHIPDFMFEYNNLKFQYAAPTFNSSSPTQYQYRLSSLNEEWSEWSTSTSTSFSGLSEGHHTFEVRAKNGFGYLSEVGSYSFVLLPPWYRTWWAYMIYVLGSVVFFTLSVKYVAMVKADRRAKQQAVELARERVINERLNDANDQLQVANTKLKEAMTLKDEFLATTSHELRTPITAILGYAALLRQEIPVEYHEFVDIIEKSGERLMSTLNALLDLAELRAGTMVLTTETFDLRELVREAVQKQEPEAGKKGLDLNAEVPNLPIELECDRSAVGKILTEVIGNAIKFTETGSVTVTAGTDGDCASVRVVDTGVGIEESFVPSLFDEFKQESVGLARSHGGNGLGLAIAGKLAELIGGAIGVESAKDEGSTFTVLIPLLPTQEMGRSSRSQSDFRADRPSEAGRRRKHDTATRSVDDIADPRSG